MSENKVVAIVSVNELLLEPVNKDLDLKKYISEGHEFAYALECDMNHNSTPHFWIKHFLDKDKIIETSDLFKGMRQINHIPVLHSLTEVRTRTFGQLFKEEKDLCVIED